MVNVLRRPLVSGVTVGGAITVERLEVTVLGIIMNMSPDVTDSIRKHNDSREPIDIIAQTPATETPAIIQTALPMLAKTPADNPKRHITTAI